MARTPALSNGRIALIGFCLILSGILGCATEVPMSPVKSIPMLHETLQEDSSHTLWVPIYGPNRIVSEGYVTYKTHAIGGTGQYRYDWFQAYCYGDGGTPYCSDLLLMQSGQDTSFTVFYPAEIGKMQIVVHVVDSQLPPDDPSGGSASKITIGIFPPAYTNPDFTCDLGEQYWPIADYTPGFPDSTKWYRRNGCTGAKEYQPAAP